MRPNPALDKRTLEISTAAMLFAVALLVRLAAIWIWRFDGLYGQDAFAYYGQAVAIAQGLPEGGLPPRDFFWPNGYPLLAGLLMGMLGRGEFAAQLVSVICGAALAPLVYGLSYELFPRIGHRTGLWAGLIVALAGQPVLSSVVIMADMAALFWATLAAWLLVRSWSTPVVKGAGSAIGRVHPGYLLSAGIALGLAIVTRWLYGLLALPFAAYALYQARRAETSLLALMAPALGGFAVLAPQVWLSLNRPEGLLHSWLLNWRLNNAFGRQFAHIDGDYSYALPVGLYYLQPLVHPNYMVPVLGLMTLWGLWRLWQARTWGPLILLGGWLAVVYLFLAGIPYENFRFGLTLYLPAVVLAGFGVEALRREPPDFVQRRLNTQQSRMIWKRGVTLVVAVCLLGMAAWTVRSAGRFLSAQNQSKTIAREVAGRLPKDATVLAFGLTLTLQHYTDLNVVEFYNLNEETLDAATATGAPRYLLLDLGNVAQQWQERPPAINYEWLQTHRTVTPVADFPPYSLFLISTKTGVKEESKETSERRNSFVSVDLHGRFA
jgi:4-amino-4-deoxy-L-arabinose transferase-like glycosyltransferase